MIDLPPPPTNQQALRATQVTIEGYAHATEGELLLPAFCSRRGRTSRVCNVRITGPERQRLRVRVQRLPGNLYSITAIRTG